MKDSKPSELEIVFRQVVAGQVKSFVKDHPTILDGVMWFKPKLNKEEVFINSLSKRLVRDLLSEPTLKRIRNALAASPLPRSEEAADEH